MHIALIGNTGSGKTTVGRALAENLRIPYIGSGDVAREMAQNDPATDLALQQGSFAPEAAMRVAIRSRIEEADIQAGGWVLDGFPRMTEQLIALMTWTVALPTFAYLHLSPWRCIERLVQRDRVGDNPDAIARKLESFRTKTEPMADLLRQDGILREFNAEYSVEALVDAIKTELS